MPRGAELSGEVVRVGFDQRPAGAKHRAAAGRRACSDHVVRARASARARTDRLTLDAPVLASISRGEREKRRPVALAAIQPRMVQAVLVDRGSPVLRASRHRSDRRWAAPVFSCCTAGAHIMAGGSTITQQLVRNVFLPKFDGMTLRDGARAFADGARCSRCSCRSSSRARASKDEILEMYLNDVPLGQRGSFAICGVSEASRLFFGKDVSNVSLAEAATIAGVIQSPSALSPFNNPSAAASAATSCCSAMADAGYIDADAAERAVARAAAASSQRALEAEAPYFVDYVSADARRAIPA